MYSKGTSDSSEAHTLKHSDWKNAESLKNLILSFQRGTPKWNLRRSTESCSGTVKSSFDDLLRLLIRKEPSYFPKNL